MTRVLAVVFVIAAAATAFAQGAQKTPDPVGITGKWAMTMEMEVGTATTALVFKQEGEKLTGTYTGRYGTYPLAGKIDSKNQIEFVVTISAEGTETLMSFWGELATIATGEVLRGGANLGGMGEASWLAKRDKK